MKTRSSRSLSFTGLKRGSWTCRGSASPACAVILVPVHWVPVSHYKMALSNMAVGSDGFMVFTALFKCLCFVSQSERRRRRLSAALASIRRSASSEWLLWSNWQTGQEAELQFKFFLVCVGSSGACPTEVTTKPCRSESDVLFLANNPEH